jgi:hypothetical protein
VAPDRRAAVRDALRRIEARDSTLTFADAAGGVVVLARSGTRIVHQGTVGVRGPSGLSLRALQDHGLSEAQARASEFVAAWFGAPFDSIRVDRAAPAASWRWGFWPLGPKETCVALAEWKARAPDSFTSMLGDYGIDVAPRTDDLRGPELEVVDPTRERVQTGPHAFDALSRDPRRIALLARVGRHGEARDAQLRTVLHGLVQPLLRLGLTAGGTRKTVADVVSSPRSLAVFLAAQRGLDLTGIADVLVAASRREADGPAEATLLLALQDGLRKHTSAAHAVRRTLSSPELSA